MAKVLQLGNSGDRVPLTVPPLPGSQVPGSAAHLGPTPSARAGHGPVADPRWGQVAQAPQLETSKGSVPPAASRVGAPQPTWRRPLRRAPPPS